VAAVEQEVQHQQRQLMPLETEELLQLLQLQVQLFITQEVVEAVQIIIEEYLPVGWEAEHQQHRKRVVLGMVVLAVDRLELLVLQTQAVEVEAVPIILRQTVQQAAPV